MKMKVFDNLNQSIITKIVKSLIMFFYYLLDYFDIQVTVFVEFWLFLFNNKQLINFFNSLVILLMIMNCQKILWKEN